MELDHLPTVVYMKDRRVARIIPARSRTSVGRTGLGVPFWRVLHLCEFPKPTVAAVLCRTFEALAQP